MSKISKLSILYPNYDENEYIRMSPEACHDSGLDYICSKITEKKEEEILIMGILSNLTSNPYVSKYRKDVFCDIYNHKELRYELSETIEHIKFLRDFGSIGRSSGEVSGIWELLHRLDEIKDYIKCVETIHSSLSDNTLKSQGLINLRKGIDKIYNDNAFSELKKDIDSLEASTDNLKSVTVGINLNNRFEAESIGLISVNKKQFSKANILKNFYGRLTQADFINDDNEKNFGFSFYTADNNANFKDSTLSTAVKFKNPIYSAFTLASIPEGDASKNIMKNLDSAANNILSLTSKKLKEVLSKYITITISDITDLSYEFLYYIRLCEYMEKISEKGFTLCSPEVSDSEYFMNAVGFYNLKLAQAIEVPEKIVPNNLSFDNEKRVYILTGANRGGKTTLTQAISLIYILAQGGAFVPASKFEFTPVDCIYTHFPIDEDKTLDLGRLGEECKRFKELFKNSTDKSLILMNESFSTTSFEEGYFIAFDAVKALLTKGARTIYNTHMHKIAYDISKINEVPSDAKAFSLIVKVCGNKRSFNIELAPPEGMSYAKDIAEKYGVTYDMLTN